MGLLQRSYRHGERVSLDGAVLRLRVDGRARRVSLRIDPTAGEVVATAPTPRRLAEAIAFAGERRAWIAERLAAVPKASPFAPGAVIEIAGAPFALISAPGRPRWRAATALEPAALIAPGEGEAFARAVTAALKREAHRRVLERTAIHAAALDKPMPVVAVADPRGRWGSCKPPRPRGFGAGVEVGRIRYSWRLLLAPAEVLDYVCAHECAHLVEANHSPRFWAVVRGLIGDERRHRAWLREHGSRLHAMGRG